MDSSDIITSVYGIQLIKPRMYHQHKEAVDLKVSLKDSPGSSNGAIERETYTSNWLMLTKHHFHEWAKYEEKGAKTVWVKGGSSGLDKR